MMVEVCTAVWFPELRWLTDRYVHVSVMHRSPGKKNARPVLMHMYPTLSSVFPYFNKMNIN